MELPSTPQFLLLLSLWTAASVVVFRHADRHGNPRATAWGIFAFLASGIAVPLYFVRFWLRNRR